jgi:hypothetical protein
MRPTEIPQTMHQALAGITPASSNRTAQRAVESARCSAVPDDKISAALLAMTEWAAAKIARTLTRARSAQAVEDELLTDGQAQVRQQRRRIAEDLRRDAAQARAVARQRRAEQQAWALQERHRQCWLQHDREQQIRQHGPIVAGHTYHMRGQLRAMGCIYDGMCWHAPDNATRRRAEALCTT